MSALWCQADRTQRSLAVTLITSCTWFKRTRGFHTADGKAAVKTVCAFATWNYVTRVGRWRCVWCVLTSLRFTARQRSLVFWDWRSEAMLVRLCMRSDKLLCVCWRGWGSTVKHEDGLNAQKNVKDASSWTGNCRRLQISFFQCFPNDSNSLDLLPGSLTEQPLSGWWSGT